MLRVVIALTALLATGPAFAAPSSAGPRQLVGDECEGLVAALDAHFANWASKGPYKVFDVAVPVDWIIDDPDWRPKTGVRPAASPELRGLRSCAAVFARPRLGKRLQLRKTRASALEFESKALERDPFWVSAPFIDQNGARLTIVVGLRGAVFLAEATKQPDGRWVGRKTDEGYGTLE